MFTQGCHQYYTYEEFGEKYNEILNILYKEFINAIFICVSAVYVDEKIYPGSNEEYMKANRLIQQSISCVKNTFYVDVYTELKNKVYKEGWNNVYYFDHFHPNEGGYIIIAEKILKKIKEIEKNESINTVI